MSRCLTVIAQVGLVALVFVTPSHAQIPDTFTNLEVLPKDIQKPELVRIMREFSNALGVRCTHCHQGDNAMDLSKVDFASDERDAKRIARTMLRLTDQINESLHSEIVAVRPQTFEVTCFTCHHGNRVPETLERALVTELKAHGIDSTLAKYRDLRETYYGRAAYDFSEWSLISIAENLARDRERADAALALLHENLVYYPQSAGTYARTAETYLVVGDTTSAMINFDKALALAPDDPWLQRRVERLKAKK
jgi:tetratricopeptide (TPR) repeat protein